MFPNFTFAPVDFIWSDNLEPHATRRRQILEKHPEIRSLLCPDPSFIYVALFTLATHFCACYMLRDSDWALVFLQAVFYGGCACNQLLLIIHETTHNTTFGPKHFMLNRLFEIFINFGLVVPSATYNWKTHRHHHSNLGQVNVDVDMPLPFEGRVFNTTLRKVIWGLIHPILFFIRLISTVKHHANANIKMKSSGLEILNHLTCYLVTYGVIKYLGWKSYTYLLISYYLAYVPFNPAYISQFTTHFQYDEDKELYSYYGPFNMICFNQGIHTEHHDFPNMTGRYLKTLKKIVPEFYDGEVGEYESVLKCMWIFLTNNLMSPSCRVARNETNVVVPNPPSLLTILRRR